MVGVVVVALLVVLARVSGAGRTTSRSDRDQEVPEASISASRKALHVKGAEDLTGGTIQGVVVGTPHYTSPEQATGQQDIDARSDSWSLGTTAFPACSPGRRRSSPARSSRRS